MAKTVEEQMISDAIAGTEKEIFNEAVGGEEADTEVGSQGDRSPEEMGEGLEGQNEADDDAEDEAEVEADADAEGEPERDPKTGQFKPKVEAKPVEKPTVAKPDATKEKPAQGTVPPGRLREEADKRRAVEQERDAALERVTKVETEFQGLSKRLDDLLTAITTGKIGQQQQSAQKSAAEEEPVPDIFADPEGYQRYMQNMVQRTAQGGQQQLEALRVELSMQAAHDKFEGRFEEAYKAVTSLNKNDPAAQQTVRRIWSSPNPGKALMSWHNQVKTLNEVGDNPAAYREKVEKDTRDKLLNDPDFIKQVMEKMRGEAENAGGQGKPRVRFAPSLNAARGGGTGQLTDRRPQDGSDAAVFESAFTD